MELTNGYPYWLIKNGLPYTYPKLLQSIKADVVIIGGGISGALTSWCLCNAAINCIVVDARTIGLGSTCASTSLLQYELDKSLSELSEQIGKKAATRSYTLCYHAIDSLLNISKTINFKETERKGSVYFAASKKDINLIEAEYKARLEAGFKVNLLSGRDIQHKFGFNAPAGIFSSQGAVTNAYMFTHALLNAGIKKGMQVFDRTAIEKIIYKRKGVELLTANGFSIKAKKIINATGYEITEFVDKKIVQLNSTYALASENIPSPNPIWKEGTMLWDTQQPYLYMRLTDDNRIIIGGRDEKFNNPTARDKLIRHKSSLLVKDFSKLFPHIPLIPEFRWTGTFGSTKDSLPFIGKYGKTPHTFYALGFGGNGIVFSAIAAEIITDMILGKKNKNAQLFSFDR